MTAPASYFMWFAGLMPKLAGMQRPSDAAFVSTVANELTPLLFDSSAGEELVAVADFMQSQGIGGRPAGDDAARLWAAQWLFDQANPPQQVPGNISNTGLDQQTLQALVQVALQYAANSDDVPSFDQALTTYMLNAQVIADRVSAASRERVDEVADELRAYTGRSLADLIAGYRLARFQNQNQQRS